MDIRFVIGKLWYGMVLGDMSAFPLKKATRVTLKTRADGT